MMDSNARLVWSIPLEVFVMNVWPVLILAYANHVNRKLTMTTTSWKLKGSLKKKKKKLKKIWATASRVFSKAIMATTDVMRIEAHLQALITKWDINSWKNVMDYLLYLEDSLENTNNSSNKTRLWGQDKHLRNTQNSSRCPIKSSGKGLFASEA